MEGVCVCLLSSMGWEWQGRTEFQAEVTACTKALRQKAVRGVTLSHGQASGAGIRESERRPEEEQGPGCGFRLTTAFLLYSTSHQSH